LSIFGSIITAYEQFVFQKVVGIVRIVLNTATMIVLLTMGYKAIAMVVVATIFNVVTLLANYWYCKRCLKVKLKFGKFELLFLKEVSLYSFWIFLNVIMDRIYWSTGQFVLGAFAGPAAVAVFAVAIQLEQMYMSFSTAISGVFLPKVTAMTVMIAVVGRFPICLLRRVAFSIALWLLCCRALFFSVVSSLIFGLGMVMKMPTRLRSYSLSR
jgi:O-antigen/teichoic acid export membrane protein